MDYSKYLEKILSLLTDYDFRLVPIYGNNHEIRIISNEKGIKITEDDITINFQKELASCTIIYIINCPKKIKTDIEEILIKSFRTKPIAHYKFSAFPYHCITHFCYDENKKEKNIKNLKEFEKKNEIFNLVINKKM